MLPNEPQTIGSVLDSGFSVYRKTLKSVAVPAIIMTVLMTALSLGMMQGIEFPAGVVVPDADGEVQPALPIISPMFWFLWVFTAAMFYMFLLVVAQRQWTLIQGGTPSLTNEFIRGITLLIPTIFASILYYLCLMVGFLLLIIPGVIVGVSMSLYMFVPIVEDRSGWLSITRSHSLVWGGNWFRSAAVFTVLVAISIALTFAFQFVLGASSGFDALVEPTEPSVLSSIGGGLLAIVLYPLITALMLALYNDLLIRKEAGDLDSRLQALDDTPK